MDQTGKRTLQVNVRMNVEDFNLIKRAANALWPEAVLTNSGILLEQTGRRICRSSGFESLRSQSQ